MPRRLSRLCQRAGDISLELNTLICISNRLIIDAICLELVTVKPRREFMFRRNLGDVSDSEASTEFRFTISEIDMIAIKLQVPDPFFIRRRLFVSAREALCIMLCKMSSTRILYDLSFFFRRSESSISEICSYIRDHLFSRYHKLIRGNITLFASRLPQFNLAIRRKGAHVFDCVGFIDGTNREICRPTISQGFYYSGHKHYHSIKYQSLVTPDGMITHLYGPEPGCRNDQLMFSNSKVRELMLTPSFAGYTLFADQGYAASETLLAPFSTSRRTLSPNEIQFNASMLKARLRVEHGFMRVSQIFAMFQRPSTLRVHQVDVNKYYQLSVLFCNIRTCLDGRNQISDYFLLAPPELDAYLTM